VFPRIASCEYVRYGVGGVQETRSALCILGLNMINDKVQDDYYYIHSYNTRVVLSRLERFFNICRRKILVFKTH
jgi:hypothetical protein